MRSLMYHRSTGAAVTNLAIAVVIGLFYMVSSADAHHKPWHDKGGNHPQRTLTLNAPASMTYGQAAETLTTTGGSGDGTVSYDVGTSNGCEVNGDKLTVTNASGTCTVTATKAGNDYYESATSAPQTVNLHKADQATLNYTGATSGTFGDKLTLSSTGGSGTGALTYEATGAACRIDPNDSTKLEITSGTGDCSVEVKKAADNNYESASSGPQTITVSKAQQETLTCNKGEFLAEYRNELMSFSTQPILTRCETGINNDWGLGSPGSAVDVDNFTARWVGTFDFEASDYEFTATSDDGIRLWIDGQLLPSIDQWKDQAATTYKATKTMTAGEHEIKVEYYENTGSAAAKVSWAKVDSPPPECSRSLQTLIDNAPAGSTLLVPACTYRESVTVPKALTIDGQGQASLRGSDVWSDFSASGGNWVSSQSVPTLHTETRDICGASSDQRCKLPEQVYLDGAPQRQIATGGDPAAGQFALSGSRQVVLGSDPTGKTVEVTVRQSWLKAGSSGVTINGFDMRHAGNRAQTGAISNAGFSNFTLQDSSFQYAHGGNVDMSNANAQRLINTRINYAGQLGLGSAHAGLEVLGGEIAHNNTEDFNKGWEAGGLKVTDQGTAGDANTVNFDGVSVHDNNGHGIWIDIDVRNTTLSNNRIYNNLNSGIFFEVSDGADIFGNVLYNNGNDASGWAWGSNILLANSRNVNVHDNVVAWGADGIGVISQNRADWPGYNNVTGVKVHNNTILRNRDGQNIFGLAWVQDWAGVLYNSASGNEGYDNVYWYPTPEGSGDRFAWNGSYTTLAAFNATPGEERGRYLSDAEKDAIVARHNLPPGPTG